LDSLTIIEANIGKCKILKMRQTISLIVLCIWCNVINAQYFAWVKPNIDKQYVSQQAFGNSVAVDKFGNVYTVGAFTGPVDPASGVPKPDTTFVSKSDANGNSLWTKQIGGVSDVKACSIALDASGNPYITGYFSDTADFDPGSAVYNLYAPHSVNLFVLKLDAAGNFVWAKQVNSKASSGTGGIAGNSIAVDASNNSYTAGVFADTDDFDPGPGTYYVAPMAANSRDIFILKLDSSGNFIWVKQIGGVSSGNAMVTSIAVEATGDVHTTGYCSGTIDFDPGPAVFNLTSPGGEYAFISKLDPLGNFAWAKQIYSGISLNEGHGVAVDISGNTCVTGVFGGSLTDFDPGVGVYEMSSDSGVVFILKLDASGNFVWAKQIGGRLANSIAVDPSGSVYTTGWFDGYNADFDPGPGVFLLPGGYEVAYISKLDATGNLVWAKQVGDTTSTGYTQPQSIAVDGFGNAYITGDYAGNGDFDPGAKIFNLTGRGAFVEKLSVYPEYITEIAKKNTISVYPNPSGKNINISSEENIDELKITDLTGRTIYWSRPKQKNTSAEIEDPGIYFLLAITTYGQLTAKIVVR
jgi:beta-propeller repeat-containing protein/type IX secretion system substrate protein